MKFNYRDRIITGVLLAIVILLAGFFALIKPKNESIKENEKTLSDLEVSKAEVDKKIAEISGLKTDITAEHKKGVEFTKDFVYFGEFENARLLDQYMQKFAEENKVTIKSLQATDPSESSIGYYYFTPTFIGGSLLAEADINYAIRAQRDLMAAESNALSQRAEGNVLQSSYTITVEAEDKENIWNYMKALEEQEKTILINSVNLTNIEIKEKEGGNSEDGEEKLPGATFTITIYSLIEMDTPNLEMEK